MRINVPLLYIYRPGTLHFSIVDIGHGRHDPDCQSLLRGRQADHPALVVETSDRRDHRGSAGAEHLQQVALGVGGHDLAHGDLPLRDGDAGPGGAELYDGPPRDAGQDGSLVQGRRDQLLRPVRSPEQDEKVHGSDLRDLVVLAKQPEALLAAVLLSNLKPRWEWTPREQLIITNLLSPQSGGVVGAHLSEATATRPCPDIAGVAEEVDGFEPRGVVRAHRAQQHEQTGVVSRGHAQGRLRPYHGGPDVERGGGVVRNPVRVNNNQPGVW